MSVFYRVRVKVSVPKYKPQFINGLYIARDIVVDVASTKAEIELRILAQYEAVKLPGTRVEVVLFRRSNIGFLLSEAPKDLEESK